MQAERRKKKLVYFLSRGAAYLQAPLAFKRSLKLLFLLHFVPFLSHHIYQAPQDICNIFRIDLRQALQLIISQQSFKPESQYGIAYYYSGFGLFYQFLVYQSLFQSGNVRWRTQIILFPYGRFAETLIHSI